MPEPDLVTLLRAGPTTSRGLCERLGVSQPTLSRRIATAGDAVIRVGQARSAIYLATRTVGGRSRFPLYRVTTDGRLVDVGELWPTHPEGYVVRLANGDCRHYEGLPWWLADMRPQGFLGRAWVHSRARGLGLPSDLTMWSDDHTLIALATGEHDVPGNLLVGENSRAAWLAYQPVVISAANRVQEYPRLATQAMAGELVGSSAGGEQPKFVANIDGQPVIVKFSSAQDNAVSRRWRDLLLAEHLALQLLASHGIAAAESELLDADRQRFLQVRRFDRTSGGGRHGLVSLLSLDASFVGLGNGNWPEMTYRLMRERSEYSGAHVITPEAHEQASRLFAFGSLIGNSDMHAGNIAFYHHGELPLLLAPIYDMLPMAFAPRAIGEMRNELPGFRLPALPTAAIWREMMPLARAFWRRMAEDERCSAEFSAIATAQQGWLDDVDRQLSRLG